MLETIGCDIINIAPGKYNGIQWNMCMWFIDVIHCTCQIMKPVCTA